VNKSTTVFLGGPDMGADAAAVEAQKNRCSEQHFIYRRGVELGWLGVRDASAEKPVQDMESIWRSARPLHLRAIVSDRLAAVEPDMEQTYALVEGVLDGESVMSMMNELGYFDRIENEFQFAGGFSDESDRQGIEQLEFETAEGEDQDGVSIWMKASWLSFEDDDASLRFRFSYGREGHEDVASNFHKEQLTAMLAEAIFPESSAITSNAALGQTLRQVTGIKKTAFVERIYYFNAPNGGALFHHDVERGHDGVVYAQLFGSTAWLALSKSDLLDNFLAFLDTENIETTLSSYFESSEISDILQNRGERQYWSERFDDREDGTVEILLNHIPAFFARLVAQGHAYILHAGDVILLPQASLEACCWHTVFCLDDFPGEALSFAVRDTPA